jgi:hypothetical protein
MNLEFNDYSCSGMSVPLSPIFSTIVMNNTKIIDKNILMENFSVINSSLSLSNKLWIYKFIKTIQRYNK